MAVAFDATGGVGSSSTGQSQSWSHTSSGSDRVAFAFWAIRGDPSVAQSAVTATYGGNTMTRLTSDWLVSTSSAAGMRFGVWYIVAPATGSQTISLSYTGSSRHNAGYSLSVTGADQTTPVDTESTNAATGGTSNNIDITAENDAMVVTFISWRQASNTISVDASGDQTLRGTQVASSGGNNGCVAVAGTVAGAGASVASYWDATGNTHNGQIAVNVNVAAAGGPGPIIVNETEQIGEGLVTLRGRLVRLNETEQIGEALIPHRDLVRQIDEVEQISEEVTATRLLISVLNEIVEISENTTTLRGRLVRLSETVEISEALRTTRDLVRLANETVQISEATLLPRNLVRLLGETVEISEGALTFRDLVVRLGETVQISEDLSLGLRRSVDEVVQISEGLVTSLGVAAQTIVIDETLQISESVSATRNLVRVLSETVQIGEALLTARDLVVLVGETVEIGDGLLIPLDELIGEVVQIGEGLVTALSLAQPEAIANETIEISEQLLTVLERLRMYKIRGTTFE